MKIYELSKAAVDDEIYEIQKLVESVLNKEA